MSEDMCRLYLNTAPFFFFFFAPFLYKGLEHPWIWVSGGVLFGTNPPHTHTVILRDSQFSSVAQSCPTLCDPVSRSTPGLPVHHQLLEFTETHIHRVSDAIQPSHPLSSSSPPAPNLSQHQSLDKCVQILSVLSCLSLFSMWGK